jgi:hypothetical protein
VISLADIEALNNQGHNDSQIAEMHDVTRQYISWIKRQYGRRTKRQLVLEPNYFWQVPTKMNDAAPNRMLRDHGHWVAGNGDGLSADRIRRLRGFWRKLRTEDVVVEFHPDIPPNPGVANKGGFAYRPRTAADGNLMIRVNDWTTMTDDARRIWSMDTIPAVP